MQEENQTEEVAAIMFVWVSEGLGPRIRICDERFHLPNRVIKFP